MTPVMRSLRSTRTLCSKMLRHRQGVSLCSTTGPLINYLLYLIKWYVGNKVKYCFTPLSPPYIVDTKRPKIPVPTPISLVHYLEDPDYEHEDFAHSSAITLRARVSGRSVYIFTVGSNGVCVCVCGGGGYCAGLFSLWWQCYRLPSPFRKHPLQLCCQQPFPSLIW